MKLDVTLGCAICGFKNKRDVMLPFDCDSLICPRCGESNCLSIISIAEDTRFPTNYSRQDSLRELEIIRKL